MTIFCPDCGAELEVNLGNNCSVETSPYDPKKNVRVVLLEQHHTPVVLKTRLDVQASKGREQRMVDIRKLCEMSGAKVLFV